MLFPKSPRIRSKSHLAFVRTLPCITCTSSVTVPGDIHAAHIRRNTDGGTSLKPSDHYTIPLCHFHHDLQHRWGEITYWKENLDKAIALAKSLYEHTGDRSKCLELIKGANL